MRNTHISEKIFDVIYITSGVALLGWSIINIYLESWGLVVVGSISIAIIYIGYKNIKFLDEQGSFQDKNEQGVRE